MPGMPSSAWFQQFSPAAVHAALAAARPLWGHQEMAGSWGHGSQGCSHSRLLLCRLCWAPGTAPSLSARASAHTHTHHPHTRTPSPCSAALEKLTAVEASYTALAAATRFKGSTLTQDRVALDMMLSLLFAACTRVSARSRDCQPRRPLRTACRAAPLL